MSRESWRRDTFRMILGSLEGLLGVASLGQVIATRRRGRSAEFCCR